MAQPLMALGLFVFALASAPVQTVQRTSSANWTGKQRVGAGPAHQFIGPESDEITINGLMMPELTGGGAHLTILRQMQQSGGAWPLIDPGGVYFGAWFIRSVEETGSHFVDSAGPRRIAFTVSLTRDWDESADTLGNLPTSLASGDAARIGAGLASRIGGALDDGLQEIGGLFGDSAGEIGDGFGT